VTQQGARVGEQAVEQRAHGVVPPDAAEGEEHAEAIGEGDGAVQQPRAHVRDVGDAHPASRRRQR